MIDRDGDSEVSQDTAVEAELIQGRRGRRWVWLLCLIVVASWLTWQLIKSIDSDSPGNGGGTLYDQLARAEGSQGTVTLRPQVYELDRPVTLPKGVTLRGDGATLRPNRQLKQIVTLESGSRLIDVTVNSDGSSQTIVGLAKGAQDVEVAASHIVGGGSERVGLGAQFGASKVTIRDSSIVRVGNAIEFLGRTSHVTIKNVSIRRWSIRGIRIDGNSSGASSHVRIHKVRIGPNVGRGSSRYPIVAGSTGQWHDDISVEDTVVIGRGTAFDDEMRPGTADQIAIRKAKGVVIRRNRSLNAGERGIQVSTARNVVVANNYVEKADTVGIGIGASRPGSEVTDFKVTGNTIIDSGMSRQGTTVDAELSAVRLTRSTDGMVSGNTFVMNATNGMQKYAISLDRVSGIKLTGNDTDSELQGVHVVEGARK